MAHYLTEICGSFFRRTFSMDESFPPPGQPSLDSNPLYGQVELFLAKMRRKPVCIKDAFSLTIFNAVSAFPPFLSSPFVPRPLNTGRAARVTLWLRCIFPDYVQGKEKT